MLRGEVDVVWSIRPNRHSFVIMDINRAVVGATLLTVVNILCIKQQATRGEVAQHLAGRAAHGGYELLDLGDFSLPTDQKRKCVHQLMRTHAGMSWCVLFTTQALLFITLKSYKLFISLNAWWCRSGIYETQHKVLQSGIY